MARPEAQRAVIISGSCPNCGGSLLIHDASTAEISCHLCARTWSCNPNDAAHDDCGPNFGKRSGPFFPIDTIS
jgi:hypothetical protein